MKSVRPHTYRHDVLTDLASTVIASLTARMNAVKMLHTRIKLLKSYLTSLPPSYLTAASNPSDATQTVPATDSVSPSPEIDQTLLRSIQALLSRLPLLLPFGDLSTFKQETLAQKSDVELVSLLGSIGQSVRDARELGRKFAIVEAGKHSARILDLGLNRPIDLDFENGDKMAVGPA